MKKLLFVLALVLFISCVDFSVEAVDFESCDHNFINNYKCDDCGGFVIDREEIITIYLNTDYLYSSLEWRFSPIVPMQSMQGTPSRVM